MPAPPRSLDPALVMDRPAAREALVGSDPVAPVRPHEIPAFEPPVPQVSAQVPDYENVPRRGQLPPGTG